MTVQHTDPATAEDRERRLAQIRTNLDQSTIKGTIPTAYCSWSDEGVATAGTVRVNTDAETRQQLETDRALLRHAPTDIAFLLSELEAAQARLDKVAEVHKPVEGFSRMEGTAYLYCWECSEDGGDGSRGHIMWPCKSARALGLGEEGTDER